MGIMCPLSPQMRAINQKNVKTAIIQHELQRIIKVPIEQLLHYSFSQGVIDSINNMPTRYMFNQGILEDIEKLHVYSRTSFRTQSSALYVIDDVKNSCLILQDEPQKVKNREENQLPIQSADSFIKNMKNNQSLVIQINILYKQQINLSQYSSSLNLFLKWANVFQEHTYGGFLKPIYRRFYHDMVKLPKQEFSSIVDQICIFVQYMVTVVTSIYGLKELTQNQNGKLIKNQNVYNLIMTFLFKRTKLKSFLIQCIRNQYQEKIQKLGRQLKRMSKKPMDFFCIGQKFTLQDQTMTQSQISKSTDTNQYVQPYFQSLKLVNQLAQNGSPITKLKTIIAISKQICKDIQKYYHSKGRQHPDLDPDNLSSIVMYLLARTADPNIFQELKIVESFTTTNCLNCISGYYLNVFIAAMESILTMKTSSS